MVSYQNIRLSKLGNLSDFLLITYGFGMFWGSWRLISRGKKYPPTHFASFPTFKTLKTTKQIRLSIEIPVNRSWDINQPTGIPFDRLTGPVASFDNRRRITPSHDAAVCSRVPKSYGSKSGEGTVQSPTSTFPRSPKNDFFFFFLTVAVLVRMPT